jgi:predicted metal-dependent peptidase
MLEDMRAIDLRGSFESDDEVGTVFTELKDIIEKYKNTL